MTGLLFPRRDFTLARWLFCRVLGAVFFSAFVSLGVQIRGLSGARGIVPAEPWLNAIVQQLGPSAFWQVPTLCWIDASDTALVIFCVLGAIFSVVLIWGKCFPGPCTLVLWALYLSLCWVTNPFLSFQWDALLLETALPAAALLPWRWNPDWQKSSAATEVGRWLLWWLLFRLMFESGLVKLASNDPTWRPFTFTALDYHFETQPLPLWTAWFANQSPRWLLWLSTGLMFIIEFVGPILIFTPRLLRRIGAVAMVALQLLILTTGNYAFFNYLTIALCLLLLDNEAWPRPLRAWFERRWPVAGRREPESNAEATSEPPSQRPPAPWAQWAGGTAMGLVVLVTVQPLIQSLLSLSGIGAISKWPPPFSWLDEATRPTMSFNGYGLFAVMTTSRHEIEVEGSNDGVNWRSYEFTWKPGDLNRRPALVAPHQPRLDWQMWFAALGEVRQNPWFINMMVRLLEGSPEVLGLLEHNPFPSGPPRFVRASLYDYHFTRYGDGQPGWWKREPLGIYCPILTLQDGHPAVVQSPRSPKEDAPPQPNQ